MTAFTRMNEIARETIQNETRQNRFPSLVDQFDPARTPKSRVINSLCHEILKKMRTALDEDSTLTKLKKNQNLPSIRETIFYSLVKESVIWEIDKLPIKFLDEAASSEKIEKSQHFRVTNICSRIFAFLNSIPKA